MESLVRDAVQWCSFVTQGRTSPCDYWQNEVFGRSGVQSRERWKTLIGCKALRGGCGFKRDCLAWLMHSRTMVSHDALRVTNWWLGKILLRRNPRLWLLPLALSGRSGFLLCHFVLARMYAKCYLCDHPQDATKWIAGVMQRSRMCWKMRSSIRHASTLPDDEPVA